MILSAESVKNIIPQKEPFVLVGNLLEISDKEIRTDFCIPEQHIMLDENKRLKEVALIENMAQTAAVRAGYLAQQEGEEPLTGFIGALKNIEVFENVYAGDTLETQLVVENEVFNASMVRATVFCEGKTIATGELKIFLVKPE